jgi:hypothetical protein
LCCETAFPTSFCWSGKALQRSMRAVICAFLVHSLYTNSWMSKLPMIGKSTVNFNLCFRTSLSLYSVFGVSLWAGLAQAV